MPSDLIVVDGQNGGGSFNVNDAAGTRLGRVDLIRTPSGKKIWDKYDADNKKVLEGACTPVEAAMGERSLVIQIWLAK
jgi:hypothetical protein